MKYLIYFNEAIECLKANKLRSFLALLGLLIGTASVVALITIGFITKATAIEQFKNLGTQKLLIHFSSNNPDDLTKLNTLLSKKNNFNKNIIANTYPLSGLYKSVYYDGNQIRSYQLGASSNIFEALKLNLKSGRFITDYDKMKYYVVLGYELVEEINKDNNSNLQIGDTININDNLFTIIGILNYWPVDPLFNYNINRTIIMPLTTAQYITNNYSASELYVDVHENTNPKVAENYLKNILNKVFPNINLQFTNAEQVLQQLEKQAQILTILLGTIGAISLLVGAIGVMNIMLVAIIERKTEIGLRMAVGATPKEIRLQFLCETICLTSIGGILGTLLGILIPYLITMIAGWNFIFPTYPVIIGLSISLGVGLTAGFYPASKASKMLPVACLSNP